MNYAIVFRLLGYVMLIEGALLLLPAAASWIYGEWFVLGVFLITAAVSAAIGYALRGIKPQSKVFYMREGFAATSLSWIVISIVGAVPFVVTGCIPNPVDSKTHTQCRCNFNGKGYIWYELRYVNPTEAMAETASIIGLITNVQHFKDKEEELMRAKDLAIEAELKQSFLANMSHEIRTPLNAIVGFSNLLVSEDDLPDEEKADFINTINTNCELLLKLINDILELSRIESGNMTFSYSTCNLNNWVDSMYLTHSLLIPKEIEFIKEVPDAAFFINTDVNRLSQIMTNFLNNATKFTKSGYIKLGYEIDFSTYEVSIYVEDTGKGIPKEEQRMIFERFYKQDEFVQGTGLGLSISMVIAEKLGGKISVASEIGKGSRFTFLLPYHNESEEFFSAG